MILWSVESPERLRKKAPQIIAVAIALIIALYFIIDFLDDVVLQGAPMSSEPIISLILSISRGVTTTVQTFGYPGIFTLMFLETSSIPIPSEVILPFAGYLCFQGSLNVWIVLVVATIAGIFGSLIDYYIGLKGMEALTKHKIMGKFVMSATQIEVAQKWFDKYGSFMVFISRLIPGFRTTLSFPAGAAKMNLPKFLTFTTAGCLLWNATLIYLGWYLGKDWTIVAGVSRYLLVVAIIAVVVTVGVYLAVKRKRNGIKQK